LVAIETKRVTRRVGVRRIGCLGCETDASVGGMEYGEAVAGDLRYVNATFRSNRDARQRAEPRPFSPRRGPANLRIDDGRKMRPGDLLCAQGPRLAAVG